MSKVKDFFKNADIVTYALIALLGVSTVFAWNQIVGPNNQPDYPVHTEGNEPYVPVYAPYEPSDPYVSVPEIFLNPVSTATYTVSTSFFDETSAEVVASSLFFYQVGNGKYSYPSQGVSFTCETDESVTVLSPLSGVVSSVSDHAARGTIVTIDHDYGLQTVLTGVYNLNVDVGDSVTQGQNIGVTGASLREPDVANVVHLEVLLNGEPIDPFSVIGQTVDGL